MLNSCKVGDIVTYDYAYYERSFEKHLIPPIGSVGEVVECSGRSARVRWIFLGGRWFRENNNRRNIRSASGWIYIYKALSPVVQEDF